MDYREHFQVPGGWSLTGHFIESWRLDQLVPQAWQAVLVRYAYAGIFIFAVRKESLRLHLFGLPFVDEEIVVVVELEALVGDLARP